MLHKYNDNNELIRVVLWQNNSLEIAITLIIISIEQNNYNSRTKQQIKQLNARTEQR